MPIIPYSLLNCAFYLYKDKADALAGTDAGGTGFFLALPTPDGLGHHYGITNYHVAVSGGYSCIRINRVSGLEVIEFGPDDWFFEPGKDDVAVVPLDIRQQGQIATFIGENLLLHPPAAAEERIGPGDDVFMVGRFVDLDARQTNIPAVRFGNISTLPVPLEQPNGYKGLCYCVDMHSRTGYSGSPVFVYRTPGNTLEWAMTGGPIQIGKSVLAILGIHCGQFPEELPIKKKQKKVSKEAALSEKAYEEYIEGMSGMTCVIPAWRIGELLHREDLVEQRKRVEATRAENAGELNGPG
jgi:hypothetical protein